MLLAHFSDVHALALDGVRPWAFLSKRAAGGLNLLLKRRNRHPLALFRALVDDINRMAPDHVVVSGDLTNLSLEPEYALARAILDHLRLGPRGVTVVPGNHDAYVWTAYLAHRFERALAPYLESDLPRDDLYPIERVRGELAVLGISTARPSPVPLADGWIGRRQLERLEAALTRQRGKFRVLVMHHPPVANRHAWLRSLRDRRALQNVLVRVGVELVVHGHEHRDLRTALPGPGGEAIPVVGIGAGTLQDGRPARRARYNLYRVERGRLVSIETRVHDAGAGSFRPGHQA